MDENNLQPNKEDIENLEKIYLKIKELQHHFEIFGIVGIIPVGSFVLNCVRKNNLVIDIIATKEGKFEEKTIFFFVFYL